MQRIHCPRCGSIKVIALSEDYFKCTHCGYTGNAAGKEIVKK
ncbi:hypothetical protein GF327_08100 [Candidatus Woesearchaeota archaeon]|nr:hypothetical protein [Candidatus Woesearchaeota archaeon]